MRVYRTPPATGRSRRPWSTPMRVYRTPLATGRRRRPWSTPMRVCRIPPATGRRRRPWCTPMIVCRTPSATGRCSESIWWLSWSTAASTPEYVYVRWSPSKFHASSGCSQPGSSKLFTPSREHGSSSIHKSRWLQSQF